MMGLMRIKAAGKLAGVHKDTIKRWQNEGHLTDHRTNGNHRRVDRDELMALLAKRRDDAKRRG